MAGPWSYDLAAFDVIETGAVAQEIALTQAIAGEDLAVVQEGAVAQSIALTQTAAGVPISGPWHYDLAAFAIDRTGAVAESITLTQAVDYWESIATDVDSPYLDATAIPGRPHYYRATDSLGNVLYSEMVTATLYRDSALTESATLTQAVAGVVPVIDGRVAQSIALSSTVSGNVVVSGATEGAVSQSVTLTQEVTGQANPAIAAVAQAITLADSVAGFIAIIDGAIADGITLTQVVAGVSAQGAPIANGAVTQAFELAQAVVGVIASVEGAVADSLTLTQAVAGIGRDVVIEPRSRPKVGVVTTGRPIGTVRTNRPTGGVR